MDKRLASTWWALKIALGAWAFIAGLDKLFNVLANWTEYLNPAALELAPVSAEVLMRCVGVVEMIVGLVILTRWTKLGAYLAAGWLVICSWPWRPSPSRDSPRCDTQSGRTPSPPHGSRLAGGS
jgi:uncharacterized membrane protein YphA (DoxX/SURF4 family)